jgi:hypothetical protein
MGVETILLIVILTFAAGYVLHRWDTRRESAGEQRSRLESAVDLLIPRPSLPPEKRGTASRSPALFSLPTIEVAS